MRKLIFLALASNLLLACTDRLDIKPDQSKEIPETVEQFQKLLDYAELMNGNLPVYVEIGADNYYITDIRFNSLSTDGQRNAYIWGKDIFPVNDNALDWEGSFNRINYCNLVLEGLENIAVGEGTAAYNNAKGSALFFRALSFYTLAQEFCKPYDSASAATDLGLPLRTTADIEKIYPRDNLKMTYEQIFSDLNAAVALLPDLTGYKTRPSKAVVYALLARIYLGLGNYDQALHFSGLSLSLYHDLLDYNLIDGSTTLSFEGFNADVMFYGTLTSIGVLRMNSSFVDSVLYDQYEENDLRKTLFFRIDAAGQRQFKGSYSGNTFLQFGGLAVDEVYLTRAECYARNGDIVHAMQDLNTLLRTRWKAGTYIDMTAANPTEALIKVLTERRKELIFRGVRWTDLRRLNKDARFAKTLTRIINGTVYQLPPNDPRYIFPIPDAEIQSSGIQQNVR